MNCLNGMSFHLRYGFIFGGDSVYNEHSQWMDACYDRFNQKI